MPGPRGYGPGGKWIHDRVHHIMRKNPRMPKSKAYAIATLQAHKLGKSPKGFRTAYGVRKARAKYDRPASAYERRADPKESRLSLIGASEARLEKVGARHIRNAVLAGILAGGAAGSGIGSYVAESRGKKWYDKEALYGALLGALLGGSTAYLAVR